MFVATVAGKRKVSEGPEVEGDVSHESIDVRTLNGLEHANKLQRDMIDTQSFSADRTAAQEETKIEMEYHKTMLSFVEGPEKLFHLKELKDLMSKRQPTTRPPTARRSTAPSPTARPTTACQGEASGVTRVSSGEASGAARMPSTPNSHNTSESPTEVTEATVVGSP